MFCLYDGRMLTPWVKGMQVLPPSSKVPVHERRYPSGLLVSLSRFQNDSLVSCTAGYLLQIKILEQGNGVLA